MARLPEYRRSTVSGGAGVVSVPRAGFVDAIGVMGREIETALTRAAIQEAETTGAQDGVQRDASGRLVFNPRPALTDADVAYNRAALVGYYSEFANDHQLVAAEQSARFRDDPAGFQAYWRGHVEGALQQVPESLRGRAAMVLGDLGSRTAAGLTAEKADRDYQLNRSSWKARLDAASADLDSLASTGGDRTPSYQEKSGEFLSLLNEGVASRFITDDQAAISRKNRASATTAWSLGRMAVEAYETGLVPAGVGMVDPRFAAWVKGEESGGRNVTNALSGAAGPYQMMPATWEDLRRRFPELGLTKEGINDPAQQERGFAALTELNRQSLVKSLGREPTAPELRLAHYFGAAGAAKLLGMPKETRFADLPDGSMGVSTAKLLEQNPNLKDITVGQLIDRYKATWAGIAGAPQGPGNKLMAANAVIGRIFSDPLLALTPEQRQHFAASARSQIAQREADRQAQVRTLQDSAQAYLVDAVQGKGEPGTLAAISARLADLGEASEAARYRVLAEREAELGTISRLSLSEQDRYIGALASGPAGEMIRANQAEQRAAAAESRQEARRLFEALKSDLDRADAAPGAIRPRAIEAMERARQGGDAVLAGEIADYFDAFAAAKDLQRKALPELDKTISDLRAAANEMQAGHRDYEMLRFAQKLRDEKARMLADDPFRLVTDLYRDQLGPVATIDWSRPEGISAALRARSVGVRQVEALEGRPIPPLFKSEIDRLKTVLDVMPIEQRTQLLGALSDGLSGQHARQLAERLFTGNDTAQGFASAMLVYRDDPQLARRVLNGLDVMKATPRIVPSATELAPRLDEHFGSAFADMDPRQRQAVERAVLAVYADSSAVVGDTSGAVDSRRLRDALTAVAGPVIRYRGQDLFPPRRDMDEADFRAALDKLSDADLPDLRTMEGDPVDAARLRRFGVLSSLGGGRYLVRMRDRDGELSEIPDPRTGAAFVLDLNPYAEPAAATAPPLSRWLDRMPGAN